MLFKRLTRTKLPNIIIQIVTVANTRLGTNSLTWPQQLTTIHHTLPQNAKWKFTQALPRQSHDPSNRAVFKWLSKVITWLQLLRLVIGFKDSRQFFNQWEAKPKPIASCTRDFSHASSELQVIARNCDWFMALFAPAVIGRSNCFGFGFSTVIWKPLYLHLTLLIKKKFKQKTVKINLSIKF